MNHKVLPRVVDVASLDANRADVGRLKWRLALLPVSWIVLSPVCIHVVVCIYIYPCGWMCLLLALDGIQLVVIGIM